MKERTEQEYEGNGQSILHVYLTQPPTESSTVAWDKSVTSTHCNFLCLTTKGFMDVALA